MLVTELQYMQRSNYNCQSLPAFHLAIMNIYQVYEHLQMLECCIPEYMHASAM